MSQFTPKPYGVQQSAAGTWQVVDRSTNKVVAAVLTRAGAREVAARKNGDRIATQPARFTGRASESEVVEAQSIQNQTNAWNDRAYRKKVRGSIAPAQQDPLDAYRQQLSAQQWTSDPVTATQAIWPDDVGATPEIRTRERSKWDEPEPEMIPIRYVLISLAVTVLLLAGLAKLGGIW